MKKVNRKNNILIFDDQDLELYNNFKWEIHHSSRGISKSLIRKENGKIIHFDKEILGIDDKAYRVDHLNGNSMDFRRKNLKPYLGRKRNKNTEYKGVCKNVSRSKGKYKAQINITLGYYNTQKKAHAVYCKAVTKMFGKDFILN